MEFWNLPRGGSGLSAAASQLLALMRSTLRRFRAALCGIFCCFPFPTAHLSPPKVRGLADARSRFGRRCPLLRCGA